MKDTNITFEPLTLAAVGTAIVIGALQALGAKIFNDIFNSENNLPYLQETEFKKIGDLFRTVINENNIRSCNSKLEAISTSIKEYNQSPDTSIDRLTNATRDSTHLVSDLKSLGYTAIVPFSTAVSIKISILQERLIKFNEPNEAKNIVDLCEMAINYIEGEAKPQIQAFVYSQFSELFTLPYFNDEYTQYLEQLINAKSSIWTDAEVIRTNDRLLKHWSLFEKKSSPQEYTEYHYYYLNQDINTRSSIWTDAELIRTDDRLSKYWSLLEKTYISIVPTIQGWTSLIEKYKS